MIELLRHRHYLTRVLDEMDYLEPRRDKKGFAYIQMKVMLTTLLKHYDFELGDDSYERVRDSLIIAPEQPCRVRYTRRPNGEKRGS